MNTHVATAQPSNSGSSGDRLRERLERELGPKVMELLRDPTVVEIMLNPDGVLWVERQGKQMEEVGRMTSHGALSVMATVATFLDTEITREKPILECELPIDGSRFEALRPPIVSAPTFAIRTKAKRIFTLGEYVESGIMSSAQMEQLLTAVRSRKNILVVGGTGSGKTTLSNAIIEAISVEHPNDRILIIEDTGELQCAAANAVVMRAVEGVTMERLLKASLRLRPDRILVGEVRDGSALTLIEAWNTGHPGGIATIHSDVGDPVAALLRMESLVARATQAPQQALIAKAVNVIASIAKTANGRKVQAITEVMGYDSSNNTYLFQPGD